MYEAACIDGAGRLKQTLYVTLPGMLPVIGTMAASMGLSAEASMVLYLGLLSGATLGGNLTPIGASANITAVGILRKVCGRGHLNRCWR